MDYNRVLKSLNGMTPAHFIERLVAQDIEVTAFPANAANVAPREKHECSLLLEGKWYNCKFNHISDDPVKGLDVQILNDRVLDQILGIKDVKNDQRIDFVGGIRGLGEL